MSRAGHTTAYCPRIGPAPLSGGSVVVTEKSADTLPSAHGTARTLPGRTIDQLVAQPLVISFAVVMCHELGKRPPKVAVTERDYAMRHSSLIERTSRVAEGSLTPPPSQNRT